MTRKRSGTNRRGLTINKLRSSSPDTKLSLSAPFARHPPFYTYWDNTRDSKLRRVTAPSANACPGLAPTTGVRAIECDYDANGNVIQTLKPQRSATAPRFNRRTPINLQ